ncbi:hypothetical protein L198_05798 [Cryptococcus wingfieldii CBS 7118]|uniref:Uncharacterized protein n=1 Tax=Cryptococcus wingfieldii CBS 7118 TaxID=1295528 RepID=A0A1E3IW41_9TREE|nr:hypothetical protein L198_05798 [Cryptococcus wingfieldii CBS 7118]ODN92126.1 hypothetical protein L198_05798 [Cryptococcus wingfieldii CBS 7118]
MSTATQAHVIVVPIAINGHLRPLLQLVLNLLQADPALHASLLVTPSVAAQVQRSLVQLTAFLGLESIDQLKEGYKAVVDRLQLVPCHTKSFEPSLSLDADSAKKGIQDFTDAMPGVLGALYDSSKTVEGFENKFGSIKPTSVIYDYLHFFVPEITRVVLGASNMTPPSLLAFIPTNSIGAYHALSSEDKGGAFARLDRLTREEIAKGSTPKEAYEKYTNVFDGKVITLPGLPPKFDFEYRPHTACIPSSPEALQNITKACTAVRDPSITGLILSGTDIGTEASDALAADLGNSLYLVGPQAPPQIWSGKSASKAATPDDAKVFKFLDDMKAKHGLKSVAYISLGSLFYPVLRPTIMRLILKGLREANIPVIFAHSSVVVPAPAELIKEFEGDEDVCVVKQAPQFSVLANEATRFIITHAGSTSVSEAILTQTPVVSLPFFFDQAEIAAQLEQAGVAIDLKQTKTFKDPAHNKLYDGTVIVGTEQAIKEELASVFEALKGAEYEKMVRKLGEIRADVEKEKNGGKAKAAMEALGKKLGVSA